MISFLIKTLKGHYSFISMYMYTFPKSGRDINFFFLIATWLLNPLKWLPIQTNFPRQTNLFFYAISFLGRPYKIKLEERSFTRNKVDTRMDDIQRSNSPKSMMASSIGKKIYCWWFWSVFWWMFPTDIHQNYVTPGHLLNTWNICIKLRKMFSNTSIEL